MLHFGHATEIVTECGFGDFDEVRTALPKYLGDRAWTSGDEPKARMRDLVEAAVAPITPGWTMFSSMRTFTLKHLLKPGRCRG